MALFTNITELQPWKTSAVLQKSCAREKKEKMKPVEVACSNSFCFRWSAVAHKNNNISQGCDYYFSLFAVNITPHQLVFFFFNQHNPSECTHISTLEYTETTGEQTCPESYTHICTNTNTTSTHLPLNTPSRQHIIWLIAAEMLRVQRNKQRRNWVREKKTGISPSDWSELKVRRHRRATHAEAHRHTHSHSKAKG